jgi:hypothetical protein
VPKPTPSTIARQAATRQLPQGAEHGLRRRVEQLTGKLAVGKHHDAVRVRRRERVVGHHHHGLAELADRAAQEPEHLGAGP